MGLSDHVNLQLKRGVKIITCDPQKRLIEAETRNGEVITVNAYHYTPMFRWPIPGEKWIVKEENGSWYLEGIYEPQGEVGNELQAEPGDAVLSSSSGRLLMNQEGKLTEIKSSKFSLVEKYIKQPGPFSFFKAYIPSTEFVTLAIISQAGGEETPAYKTGLYIDKNEVGELEYHGSVIPMTLIIPKGQGWELRAFAENSKFQKTLEEEHLKSVAYAFFPE